MSRTLNLIDILLTTGRSLFTMGRFSEALEPLRRLSEFRSLGCPILVGPSRKSFIGTVLGNAERDRVFGTAAVVAVSILNGASIVRVHDVAAMRDVVLMTRALA